MTRLPRRTHKDVPYSIAHPSVYLPLPRKLSRMEGQWFVTEGRRLPRHGHRQPRTLDHYAYFYGRTARGRRARAA